MRLIVPVTHPGKLYPAYTPLSTPGEAIPGIYTVIYTPREAIPGYIHHYTHPGRLYHPIHTVIHTREAIPGIYHPMYTSEYTRHIPPYVHPEV